MSYSPLAQFNEFRLAHLSYHTGRVTQGPQRVKTAVHEPSSGASGTSPFGWTCDDTGWWVFAQISGSSLRIWCNRQPEGAMRLGRDLDGLSFAVQEQVVHR